ASFVIREAVKRVLRTENSLTIEANELHIY
ncbi:MAG: hypothetical protein QG674_167, partial [Patescibacteria group bacterium]|nr:hypothetical protein [Patescibacteria group bacterium]